MQTIGERLEEARKKKGISIREAAEATKIRGDYLQKFESNHFDIGLTEIYTRGFLRSYANYLKLPADRILNDYLALGRGEVRPRQPSREIYGRMDISVATAGEPSDRAAPPEDPPPEPEPARTRAQPRYPRGGGAALPTGPDPAVVFQYLKWGIVAVVLLVAILVGKSLLTPTRPAHETTATSSTPPQSQQPTATAPAPAGSSFFTLVALDAVRINVNRKLGENEGEEILSATLARGQSQVVPWNSPVYIRASDGDNLQIEIKGKRYPAPFHGYGRCALEQPK